MCILNLDEISQSTFEKKLIAVWEKGRSPYWNSISCFNFDLCWVNGMWFCNSMWNYVSIRRSPEELWRNIDFSRWRPWSPKATSMFSASDCIRLRRWKSVCVPNFDEISQCTAEIKLLPVRKKDCRHIGILLRISILTYVYSSACNFALACQISL